MSRVMPRARPRRPYRLRDQAQDGIAELAGLATTGLFAGVPDDGLDAGELRPRFEGTRWEPLLWAAPWLWRLSGNAFLDLCLEVEQPEPGPWCRSTVFRLTAEYRQALRVMDAVDAFDAWLAGAPAERARGAVRAALRPRLDLA
jgi:hypothetical protein